MDFYMIKEKEAKKGTLEVYPDFQVVRSKDLMVRAKSFYAIWDEEKGLWSTDEFDVQRLVDAQIHAHKIYTEGLFEISKKYLGNFSSNSWLQFRNYVSHLTDNSHQLDDSLTFADTEVKKEDYVSRRLPYSLREGDISAWAEMMDVLYTKEERAKIEWAIGAVVSGDSKSIQKFLVFYGSAGTGKSTVMNIIAKLFEGYTETFEAKALTAQNNAFATEIFKSNPLVAINHDGDLSKITDVSKLNSIVSHEYMTMNEKFKPSYTARINAMLFMGTNSVVRIPDAKSGLIRRMIDVQPTGNKIAPRKYQALYAQIDFELGAIAQHCLNVYRVMGKHYYDGYKPVEMMLQTDIYFNFIEDHFDLFKAQGGVTLQQAFDLYKKWCDDSGIEFKVPRYKFREELRNYFENFEERAVVDDVRVRSWYSGFITDKFTVQPKEEHQLALVLEETESILDERYADYPAQYANAHGTPIKYWRQKTVVKIDADGKRVELELRPDQIVDTTLKDLDTSQLHYVKFPDGEEENEIVIDFDLKDDEGNKSLERNLEEASKWPATYTELSQGGNGLHLHYIYEGDVNQLSRIYSEGIEIKVFTGDSSLRRRVLKCNNLPIARLSGGLPLREKKLINQTAVKTERSLRSQIARNLRKEIHPGTKPSMDFIHHILEEAYISGLQYDVTDMRPDILQFAMGSTHQALYCMLLVQSMRFHSETAEPLVQEQSGNPTPAFFDCEVFPNLFVLSWKYEDNDEVVSLINPTPQQVEEVMTLMLIGYNCRRYDNHIVYARYLGYSLYDLYLLSQKIVNNTPGVLFGEAYEISYTDIYDYASEKKSLKKWQIELGLKHKELGLPWDEPVDESLWPKVVEYCENDVRTTEQVHKARKQDFIARQILSELSGLSVNATTQQHASRIVFNGDSRPQQRFVYTDLSEQFPGYEYDHGKSTYRGEITGEGGYVYAEPGMYTNVALLDVASMHPTSIEELNLFGEYTKNFSALKSARIAIKHKDYDSARQMLDGKLAKFLEHEDESEDLSYALKIVINIVYGLTAARFDNSFKDPRNIDNIVAKRGALFMIDLKNFVQEKGFTVAHIKTDSIKIPDATKEIIDLVMEFGEGYGYTFEHEETYDKFCLVNDAVYVAKTRKGRKPAHWVAVGAQFQHPYVFKQLFSKEHHEFEDYCETKTVTTALYLDFSGEDTPMALENKGLHFVGKGGLFTPICEGRGGALLLREKDGKFYAATGTKGYRWLESEMVLQLEKEDYIDLSYFTKLVDEAVKAISQYGDFEWFAS